MALGVASMAQNFPLLPPDVLVLPPPAPDGVERPVFWGAGEPGTLGVRVGSRVDVGGGIWSGAQVGTSAIEGPAQCPPGQLASFTQLKKSMLPPSQNGSVDTHPEPGHWLSFKHGCRCRGPLAQICVVATQGAPSQPRIGSQHSV